ncbi:MAG: phosphoribosylformylglycinamidine synthase [Prevotellaceae bacterium]|nr:phosphoribosylformylglycinamidine synthase [Prevotellaceae bacterium]
MIHFFRTKQGSVVAVGTDRVLTDDEKQRLCWLMGEAQSLDDTQVEGEFVGPRREMVSPWSTAAVEIAQNMGVAHVQRIEEYQPMPCEMDPMLQNHYEGLDQQIFSTPITPAPIIHIDDLEAYNEQEGLALSKEEIEYLHGVERQLGRLLTDSEVFGFAQINSEHCRHKIFGGRFIIDGEEKPQSLFSLIKRTTQEHQGRIVSAYKDNVAFAEGPVVEQFSPRDHATPDWFEVRPVESVISLKAETHNFPTTVEPFNGAATGTGGEIRDRMGGGVGSWPLAGTAVYMTSRPTTQRHWLYQSPQQILIKASNGASDFGNKFGQPLITGSVFTFDHEENDTTYGYDKVIMLAGGVGYGTRRDCLKGEPQKGDKIVVVGGDNYRIGLGGGSVSSVDTGRYGSGIELNAVQRANPEMQKRANNLIRALCEEEVNPVVSIHDHGSAGHVNCLSELVETCGGHIDMASLPIGDTTLSAKEIIANESQERMGLLIREQHIEHVRKIAERERAPLYVVGETTGDAHFSFEQADGVRPFDLDVAQMFGHSPVTVMKDETVVHTYANPVYDLARVDEYVEGVLRLEGVACKDWLTNKVDRSVTGKVARQQCVGELQLPLSDCGVVALDYRGRAGIATAIGHAPIAGLANAEAGSVLSVAESLTNLVWAPLTDGLDGVSLSANWMWPCRSQRGEDARLYAAVQALSEFCINIGVNVPTGKDSLSMTQKYPDGKKVMSPGTVIVSAGGEVSDVRKVVSPVIVNTDSTLYHIDFSFDSLRLGGSAFAQSLGYVGSDVPTVANPEYFADAFNAIQSLVNKGLLLAGHDISAGGLVTALFEMTFSNVEGGLNINLNAFSETDVIKVLFAENPGVVIQVANENRQEVETLLENEGIAFVQIGHPVSERKLILKKDQKALTYDIDAMRDVWYATSTVLDRQQSMNGMADERFRNFRSQPVRQSYLPAFTGKLAQYGLNPDRWKTAEGEPQTGNRPRAAIIREKGTNGEREMAYSLWLAGFDVKDVMMTDLVSGRETLEDISFIVFCGGFSNSDVFGSAKGWAGAFLYNPKAKAALDAFYARKDTLSLGICNGCQLMVELGLLDTTPMKMEHNVSHKFESEFVTLDIPQNDSVMLGSMAGSRIGIWVAHGEGRFALPNAESDYHIAAKYTYSGYPGNPNGSSYDVAALTSPDGRHLAMMPHLERAIFPWQMAEYPLSRRAADEVTPWMEAFVNARKWVENNK